MGRIVIPRVRQEARQQLQRKRRTGYFANGFGPQEMRLVSQLADLAVAGGGQIARAVQISNREKEQAEAQAEYDQRLQSEIESRQRAAQAEIADVQLGGGPQAFMSDFFFNRPDVALKPADSPDTSALRGATQQRGAPIIALSGVAPEDARKMLGIDAPSLGDARAQRLAPEDARPPLAGLTPADLMQRTRLPGLRAAYQSALARGDVGAMGRIAREGERLPGLGSAYPTPPEVTNIPSLDEPPPTISDEDLAELSRLAAAPRLEAIAQARAQALQQAQQAMQGRDFRREAMEAIGPAPERKLFRIADILAAAPSARTAEQRAMLLQAAADSPDIQATGLSDLAKGAYRDRAMQAVMKLFPEEEEPMSELDKLRIESTRERIETENLRQQKLQAELDKDAADAERRANAVVRVDPELAKKEALYAFYTKNWPRKEAMGDEAWSAGAGELADRTPAGLAAWTRNNKLSRATRKSVNATAGRLLQMRPKADPAPKGDTDAMIKRKASVRAELPVVVKDMPPDARTSAINAVATGNTYALLGVLRKHQIDMEKKHGVKSAEAKRIKLLRSDIVATSGQVDPPELPEPEPTRDPVDNRVDALRAQIEADEARGM